MDTQGQCNLIRTKNFHYITYKKYIYTTYTTYNIKIYQLYDIYIYDIFIIFPLYFLMYIKIISNKYRNF